MALYNQPIYEHKFVILCFVFSKARKEEEEISSNSYNNNSNSNEPIKKHYTPK